MEELYLDGGGIWAPLNTCVGLFILLLSLLGAVQCLKYRGLSSRLLLAMIGFLLAVFLGLVNQVGLLIVRRLDFGSHTLFASLNLGIHVGVFLALALILGGFELALSDIQRKMSRMQSANPEPPLRLPPSEAADPFRERKEGSPDIQR